MKREEFMSLTEKPKCDFCTNVASDIYQPENFTTLYPDVFPYCQNCLSKVVDLIKDSLKKP